MVFVYFHRVERLAWVTAIDGRHALSSFASASRGGSTLTRRLGCSCRLPDELQPEINMPWRTGLSIPFVETAPIPIHPLVGCRTTGPNIMATTPPAIPGEHSPHLLPPPSHRCGLFLALASLRFIRKAPAVGVGSARPHGSRRRQRPDSIASWHTAARSPVRRRHLDHVTLKTPQNASGCTICDIM
jgi:hypothetical protein